MQRDEILTPGSYQAIPKAIMQRRDVSPAAKLVLASLVDHLGPTNETTWPGPATIAEETGLTRNGVQKCIAQLVQTNSSVGLAFPGDIVGPWIFEEMRAVLKQMRYSRHTSGLLDGNTVYTYPC